MAVLLLPAKGNFLMDCSLENSTLSFHVEGSLPDGGLWDTRNNIRGGQNASLSQILGNYTSSDFPFSGEFPMDCPLEDSTLSIHIKGSLPDGTVFWDTRNNVGGGESAPLSEVPGEPYEFATGEGLVRQALQKLKSRDLRERTFPYDPVFL
jgi:hypothetical protein